ncbi:polysaccharide deacetylase family protein [Anaerofustis stercorihominis]|uniref:Polysaccharide deacetylase family protein n=1 Tax=Anaerofustis stercorihominis TaxID=214853 RepID=A0A3E3DWX1_9FIRM|nr:polysaccharide deacetylase family protein [Anaerofustis stercorihominis]RGD73754.1 polysaccharide deacetylase family protein [Anaerofustis stercorihominis]
MKLIIISISIVICAYLCYSLFPTYIYKISYRQKKKNEEFFDKSIYLTFDDGPDKDYTIRLLDLLQEYNVKASFFIVGTFALDNPGIIERMKNEGHSIGLHWYEHKSAMLQTPRMTKDNMNSGINALKELGINTKLFRPPWGQFNLSMISEIKKNNMTPVLWDVMAEDWEEDTTTQIIKDKLINRVNNNDIICLHDGRGKNKAPLKTIEALREMIPNWLNQGYTFKTVGEKYER